MEAEFVLVTFWPVTVNCAVVLPRGIVTVAGTVATAVFELARLMMEPLIPAASDTVTVPVVVRPAAIEFGYKTKFVGITGGYTLRFTGISIPAYAAVTTNVIPVFTVTAVTVKGAVLAPCGTVTQAGTVAPAVFELESATAIPPDPAGVEIVTIPAAVCPFAIKLGLSDIPVRVAAAGSTVSPKPSFTPAYDAVRLIAVGDATESGVAVKFADVRPAATVTVAGIETSG